MMRKGCRMSVTSLSLGSPAQPSGLVHLRVAEDTGEDADLEDFHI